MANTKLVVQDWGIEIHRRKDEKSEYSQVGAMVEACNDSTTVASRYLGRELTAAERTSILTKGFVEV